MKSLADELVHLASGLAREAGELVASGRRDGIHSLTTKSSATDMVTEFDQASERLIVHRLTVARPDDGIIGEEGTATNGSSGVRWLIDPIDGTTNFMYGLPGYGVSIAAVDENGPLAGVVYVPALDELFAARRDGGAMLNGTPIHCGAGTDLASALVGTGFSYLASRRATQAARVARLIPKVRDIRRLGAASVDLCFVAMGRLDAYFEEFLGPWDLAAGELIAREAGCITGDFHGGPARPQEVLVTNRALFEPLAQAIRDATD
ncbi:MAG: suhB [Ilumatobacteraceae bacterium]|nr:suhB [Ilumatobacteraceae bacterium]